MEVFHNNKSEDREEAEDECKMKLVGLTHISKNGAVKNITMWLAATILKYLYSLFCDYLCIREGMGGWINPKNISGVAG